MTPIAPLTRRRFVQAASAASAVAAAGLPGLARAQSVVSMRFSSSMVADQNAAHYVWAQAFESNLKAGVGDRIKVDYFPNNQLGGDTDMLSQVRNGAIDIFPLSGLILQTLVPLAGINGLAFAFKDYATVWAAMDGDLGAYIRAAIAKVNLYSFDKILDNGFRNITTSTKPIVTAEDLKGFKIRVPVSPLWTSMFKAFGASGIS